MLVDLPEPSKCGICGRPLSRSHKYCQPGWKVWCPDDGETREDAKLVNAHDADMAAGEWAQRYDEDAADYPIADGTVKTVCVTPWNRTEPLERFKVRGEFTTQYFSEELD